MDSMMRDFSKLSLLEWILLASILLMQSIWLFLDARKRNAAPWFWGLWGLIQFPMPLVFYLFIVRKIHKGKKNK